MLCVGAVVVRLAGILYVTDSTLDVNDYSQAQSKRKKKLNLK